jgi:hypothetical protein
MKRVWSHIFEKHPILVVSLGRVWLWILKFFKPPVMMGAGVNF